MVIGRLGVIWDEVSQSSVWVVYSLEHIYIIQAGDFLEVIANVEQLHWAETIDLDYSIQWSVQSHRCGQLLCGWWFKGFQRNMNPKLWAEMFFEGYRAKLIPATID